MTKSPAAASKGCELRAAQKKAPRLLTESRGRAHRGNGVGRGVAAPPHGKLKLTTVVALALTVAAGLVFTVAPRVARTK